MTLVKVEILIQLLYSSKNVESTGSEMFLRQKLQTVIVDEGFQSSRSW